ncbi:helix-turn-helix domain-containing protein [Flavobacterium sp. MFBS3-15]|uniref:helix-turn-helix transcriptional regulator n=1 Tax=Flavobacterium sp. MFBS3-15 TaxID=2989816 RepID=UPI002235AF91|nr:helix-turn-helix domain-containing protein [Flavobacterium sp. MFBS3-15]MCW4470348.1 helix-turn-helix domain-containing protein [Flavobacterium sp. MFBS3-15]
MNSIEKKLLDIEALVKKQYVLSKNFLTLEEAAGYLNLSKSALYKLTSSKEIPYYVPGGKIIYFRRAELDSWLLSNRVSSTEELNSEVNDYINRILKA